MKNALILILCTLVASPCFADVKLATDHGFMIENSSQTDASPDRVYAILVEEVDNWWPKDHSWWRGTFSIEQTPGGCFCENADDKQAQHMRIVHLAPPTTLVMVGGLGPLQQMGISGALTWSVEEQSESGRTTVTLTYNVHGVSEHDFTQLARAVDNVQASQLKALTDYASQHNNAH